MIEDYTIILAKLKNPYEYSSNKNTTISQELYSLSWYITMSPMSLLESFIKEYARYGDKDCDAGFVYYNKSTGCVHEDDTSSVQKGGFVVLREWSKMGIVHGNTCISSYVPENYYLINFKIKRDYETFINAYKKAPRSFRWTELSCRNVWCLFVDQKFTKILPMK